MSADVRRRLANCEAAAARRSELSWDFARLTDAEIDELMRLELRIAEAGGDEGALSGPELRRRDELCGEKCVMVALSPEVAALSDAELVEWARREVTGQELAP